MNVSPEIVTHAAGIGWGDVYQFAKEWQTFVAGLVALAAAGWTVRTIKKQIGAQRDQLKLQQEEFEEEKRRHEERRRAIERAARAELPDALSALGLFSRQCVDYIVGKRKISEPTRPTEAVRAIKQAVGAVDEMSAKGLIDLLHWYQIHTARYEHRVIREDVHDWQDRIRDSIVLWAKAVRLFGYARHEVEVFEPAHELLQYSELRQAFLECVGFETDIDAIPMYADVLKYFEDPRRGFNAKSQQEQPAN